MTIHLLDWKVCSTVRVDMHTYGGRECTRELVQYFGKIIL
jgi:hypothetical protein